MDLSNLNPQQKLAVEAAQAPLLIVAGAGTGKTRTLTSRLLYFIEKGVRPERICAITFTNKAAKEMASHIASHKPQATKGQQQPFIGTFHALGAKILRSEAEFLGRKSNFAIFDDHDSFDLIKKIVKRFLPPANTRGKKTNDRNAESKSKNNEKPTFFAQKISEIKNTSPQTPVARAIDGRAKTTIADREKPGKPADQLLSKIFMAYENDLAANNAFDFDDLIEKVVYLFKKYPEVLKKYGKKFDALMVDEYQDLNPMQYEFIKFLAASHMNLSVVGDDEQQIYGWRYADLKTFLNFERDWPGAQITFLEENYRSTANIIRAALAVVKNNQYRRPKNLWTKNADGALIKIIEAEDEEKEAESIASEISKVKLIKQSVAVLYRTNAQSRAIEQALIKNNIGYKIFGGIKFYERKEIKDIVAALRYFINRSDSLSRERLEKNFSKSKVSDLRENFFGIKGGSVTPVKLIEYFLRTTEYFEYLERNFMNSSERQENIGELLNFAAHFDDPQAFLEEIALVQAGDMAANSQELQGKNGSKLLAADNSLLAVNLMTIHLAKGLEFDKVFIAGLSEGLLPHARSLSNEHQLEEERRLMYVAMTRAKKDLSLSFFDIPSRFIGEIPNELIEYKKFSPSDLEYNDDVERSITLD